MSSGRVPKPILHIPLRTLITSNMVTPGTETMVSSPMSNLALNLSELSTGRGTPKRRLSLSSVDTPTGSTKPTPERMSSTESGCFVDSPTPIDSPTLDMSLNGYSSIFNSTLENSPEVVTKRKTFPFRRINSLPLPTLRYDSPIDFQDKENCSSANVKDIQFDVFPTERPTFDLEDTCSQDSGLGFGEKDEHFQFAAPVGVPPRKLKIINEDTCSPKKYSPVKSPSQKRSFSATFGSPPSEEKNFPLFVVGSPIQLKTSPLTSCDEDVDDGFLDVFDQEVAQINDSATGSMSSLFNAPLLIKEPLPQDEDTTPVSRRTASKMLLQRSQSFDVRSRPFSYKRSEPFKDEKTPVQNKRRRPGDSDSEEEMLVIPASISRHARKLHRCHSETEALIKSALNRLNDEPDLIGDCSKPYCLPTVASKHQDLKGINPDTISKLINNEYSDIVGSYCIVDCRYPYEFQGGHIKGAVNIYTKDDIIEELLKKPVKSEDPEKRTILIFHCEFSSERAPNLSRFLRNRDRDVNKECYPALHYPELYLLEGGYKVFYESHKEHCIPQDYKPMLHKEHGNDLRRFRAKSKSWAGEKGARPGLRTLKF